MKTQFDIYPDWWGSWGSYIKDSRATGNVRYLDMFGMWSSLALGYNHPIFAAFEDDLRLVAHFKTANNVFPTYEMDEWLEKFRPHVFSDNIHLCCTGSLAVESALKSALEVKDGDIYGLHYGFHGINSWGAVTSKRYGYRLYNVFYEDCTIFDQHSLSYLLKMNIKYKTSAIIVELIQCTNGDTHINPVKLRELQKKCKKDDICFIIDEIQTGFGVTGDMWYYKQIGLEDPDILIFGKKAQVSGIVTSDKYAAAMNSPHKKLSVTFDGDLIDVIRSTYILRAYEKYNLLKRAKDNAFIFKEFCEHHNLEHRITGHLIAFDFASSEERDKFAEDCYGRRLLVNKGGEKSIRLRPHMAVTPEEIKHAIEIMSSVLK